jgi:hypothetical protein
MHSVKIVGPGDFEKRHDLKVQHKKMHCEPMMFDDEDAILKDIAVCIKVEGRHKKMIENQMKKGDIELEEMLKELEKDENILIEFEDGGKKMKVMKIKINGDDLDEIETIEIHKQLELNSDESEDRMKRKGPSSAIKAYPNPANDLVNIEFEVLKGNAELSVRDMDGKVIFSKKYKDAGKYQERVKLANAKNKILFVELKEERRLETRKIIVD